MGPRISVTATLKIYMVAYRVCWGTNTKNTEKLIYDHELKAKVITLELDCISFQIHP